LTIIPVTGSCFNSGWFFLLKKPNTALQHFWTALKPLLQGPIKVIKMEGLRFGTSIRAKGELQKKERAGEGRENAAGLSCGHTVGPGVAEGQE